MFNQYGSPYGYGYPTMGGFPMPAMLNTGSLGYTSPGGGTNQGKQLQSLSQLLAKITSNPSQVQQIPQDQLQNLLSEALGISGNLSGNQGTYAERTQNANLNAAGIPGLIGQYGDLSKQFSLWLADKGFASNFGNQSPTANLNPFTNAPLQAASALGAGQLTSQNQADQTAVANMSTPQQPGTTSVPPPAPTGETANPFLGSPQSVIDSTSNLPTPPSVVTAQMGAQMGGASNMLNLINSLIGAETGVASNATTQDIGAYQDKMNTINNIVNMLGGAIDKAQANTQNAINMPGTTQNAAAQYQTLKDNFVSQMQAAGKAPTWDGLWYFINSQKNALAGQGVNVNEIYRLQGLDQKEFGGGGNIASGSGKVVKPLSGINVKTSVDTKGNRKAVIGGTTLTQKAPGILDAIEGLFGQGVKNPVDASQVNSFYQNAKKEGYSDQQIIDYLKQHGWQ